MTNTCDSVGRLTIVHNQLVLTLESEIVACGNKDHLTDPLCSLVKEISSGASLGKLVEMYPYGTRTSFGTRLTIPFVYVGAYGYYTDSNDRDYVRARSLMKKSGRWMQTDPLWPEEMAFGYANSNPILYYDYTGMAPCKPIEWGLCAIQCGPFGGVRQCIGGKPGGQPQCRCRNRRPPGGRPSPALLGVAVITPLIICIGEAAVGGLYKGGQNYDKYRDWCFECCKDVSSGIGGVVGGYFGSGLPIAGNVVCGVLGGVIGYAGGHFLWCKALCDQLMPPIKTR